MLPNAKRMRRLGFSDHREGYWYRGFPILGVTTFELTINKETGEYRTLVVNESFGQPEYYGHMKPVYRNYYVAKIDLILHELAESGFDIAFNHSEYGGVEHA